MRLRPLDLCAILTIALIGVAGGMDGVFKTPARATETSAHSLSGSSEDKTNFRGTTGSREYVVRVDVPGYENESVPDDYEGATTPEGDSGGTREGDSTGGGRTDPLKVYVGDPTSLDDEEHDEIVPENLCRSSPHEQATEPGCSRIVRTSCGPGMTVLSYEIGNGVSRARCISNDEIDRAIDELRNEGQDTIPAAAHTAFTDLSLEPAVVKFEPDLLGFGYEGRHTNMYADVDTQTVSQELLGQTVQIRAIPQEFHWDYGDGTSRTTFEPGGPLPDYDGTGQEIVKTDFKTVTSHVYEETGIYPVTVETVYTGQFRVGDGEWRDIPGTVSVESSPGEADIWTQNSRWVSGACESTDEWGCNGPIEFDPATDRPPKIYQDQYDENGRWLGPVE